MKPTPAPPERFVTIDGAVTGKTYDEFAPGTGTGGWGIRGTAEVPIIGHNWAATVDYRSYNYQQKALGGTPNGFVQGCPIPGDQGCVTPIGTKTYNSVFNPGPVNYSNAFGVQDSDHADLVGFQDRADRALLSQRRIRVARNHRAGLSDRGRHGLRAR